MVGNNRINIKKKCYAKEHKEEEDGSLLCE
jgi:hypothetical protein